jgi:hypothetical protein
MIQLKIGGLNNIIMGKDRDQEWYIDQYNRNRPADEWIKLYVEFEVLKLQMQMIERENAKEEQQTKKDENKETL